MAYCTHPACSLLLSASCTEQMISMCNLPNYYPLSRGYPAANTAIVSHLATSVMVSAGVSWWKVMTNSRSTTAMLALGSLNFALALSLSMTPAKGKIRSKSVDTARTDLR